MSRTSHADTLNEIIDSICKHPRWDGCPETCSGMSPKTPCPIRENRKILLEDGTATLKTRLRSLIDIAAADDKHLSIRQIIILVVNALLGDAKKTAPPLLDCSRARSRAENGEYHLTNPFSNIFGENHDDPKRFAAFAALGRFAIGYETNNFFDDELLASGNRLPNHHRYGTDIFQPAQTKYLDDQISPEKNPMDSLREPLIAQRRRLFFTAPDISNHGDQETNPWNLSIYQYGHLYTNLLLQESKRNRPNWKRACERIVRGLNRAMTESLTATSDQLWLTEPSCVYRGMDIPLLVAKFGWDRAVYFLKLDPPSNPGRTPQLNLVERSRSQDFIINSLSITPTLFEYLMRIAEGALPISFSSQCSQNLRNFQIKSVGSIQKFNKDREGGTSYRIVKTESEVLHDSPLPILDKKYSS